MWDGNVVFFFALGSNMSWVHPGQVHHTCVMSSVRHALHHTVVAGLMGPSTFSKRPDGARCCCRRAWWVPLQLWEGPTQPVTAMGEHDGACLAAEYWGDLVPSLKISLTLGLGKLYLHGYSTQGGFLSNPQTWPHGISTAMQTYRGLGNGNTPFLCI